MGAIREKYRWYRVPEDAGDDAWLRVPNPPEDWSCDCGLKNPGRNTDCAWCGRDRPDIG